VLSLAAWFLVVPVIGMMHVVILPVAVVLLLASLRIAHPRLYRYGLYGTIVIYLLGIVGFICGLLSPETYGRHIEWAEAAYKVAAPILLGLFSLPLCLDGKRGSVLTE
jgi:TctA family transporter